MTPSSGLLLGLNESPPLGQSKFAPQPAQQQSIPGGNGEFPPMSKGAPKNLMKMSAEAKYKTRNRMSNAMIVDSRKSRDGN